ncbi:MAG TPA: SMP-30/gluconolactonase/LRE family protein [Gemmatimonadales bacterium]|nr:SMP-30/gluconolactonase/LRE family protein [Gemmatimonadales bacterium]
MIRYLTAGGLLAFALMLGGCGDRGTPEQSSQTSLATDSAAAAPAAAKKVGEIKVNAAEAVRYDPELDLWYVASFGDGEPSPMGKDNNGVIGRYKADGTPDSAKFIAGGRGGARLNAPKGMVIVGDTLWVADIDAVRGFNRRTGAPLATINVRGAKFLNDIAVGPDGALYLTDSGLGPDPKTGLGHTGPDRIYRIGADRKATVALEDTSLAAPNGITWDSAGRSFVIVPFFGQQMVRWSPGDSALQPLASGKGQQDGVEPIGNGRLLVTSWVDSSLNVVEGGRVTRLAGGVPSAADIGWDPKHRRAAVPLLMQGRVEIWEVP